MHLNPMAAIEVHALRAASGAGAARRAAEPSQNETRSPTPGWPPPMTSLMWKRRPVGYRHAKRMPAARSWPTIALLTKFGSCPVLKKATKSRCARRSSPPQAARNLRYRPRSRRISNGVTAGSIPSNSEDIGCFRPGLSVWLPPGFYLGRDRGDDCAASLRPPSMSVARGLEHLIWIYPRARCMGIENLGRLAKNLRQSRWAAVVKGVLLGCWK
jgi:hypothetical protein